MKALYVNLARELALRRGPTRPKAPSELAAMAVGEVKVFPWTMYHYRRVDARRELKNPKAQWRTTATNQGCRVLRVK